METAYTTMRIPKNCTLVKVYLVGQFDGALTLEFEKGEGSQ